VFLAIMEKVVLCRRYAWPSDFIIRRAWVERPPDGLERMLRMYLVQHWFNHADVGCEEPSLESTAQRRLVSIDFERERVPDGHEAVEVSSPF
jgi:transposase, IS5 family